jgi:hypothetical protein
MKKLYFSISAMLFFAVGAKAQAFCNPSGNVIIYSNYDGGILNINVDQNIPNLKIGVCTYESVKIQISGAFASNVTEVVYAGYNGNNDNCSLGVTNTAISGVPSATTTINVYPAAGYSNANGSSNIVCNYSCNSTTNQGGCNTPDQIVYYFMNLFGGTYYYHHTQYNCWTNAATYSVSTGGNCCIVPTTLNTNPVAKEARNYFFPNPATDELNVRFYSQSAAHTVEIFSVLGEKVKSVSFAATAEKATIDVKDLKKGIYFVRTEEDGIVEMKKIVLE